MSLHTVKLLWEAIVAFIKFYAATPYGLIILLSLACAFISKQRRYRR